MGNGRWGSFTRTFGPTVGDVAADTELVGCSDEKFKSGLGKGLTKGLL